jgi:hypothetical protein
MAAPLRCHLMLDFFGLSVRVDRVNRSDSLGQQSRGIALPASWRMALLFIILALLRGLVYAALIPPWQSPDEQGHFEYAWLVSQHGPLVGPEAISPEFQQRVLESMAQFDYWRLVHQPTPKVLPSGFTDPSDPWLVQSRPQVGDERPLYYWLVGGILRLAGSQDMVVGMYMGRITSVLMFAAAVGLASLTARSLFPHSLFMQVVPPAFVLFLPMLGEMAAAVNSDAMGVLTSTIFFASLVPVFRNSLTWRRGGAVVVALALALLSKKTTPFLIPTTLLALLIYGWTRGARLSRWMGLTLAVGTALLLIAAVVLVLIPGGDAAGWTEWTQAQSCEPTRFEGEAFEGDASLRVQTCGEAVAQVVPPEAMDKAVGSSLTLNGRVRGAAGPAVGRVTVWDNNGQSQTEIAATVEWQAFTLAHTVDTDARWVAVRLAWGGSGGALLFDDLILSTEEGENLLVNGSAEQEESLLLDLLSDTAHRVGAPRRMVERTLSPQSWSREAWREYTEGAFFCLYSFWGHFGWSALPLPLSWYRVLSVTCLLALVGNLVFLVDRPCRRWQVGYLLVLMCGVILLALQTLLPMVGSRGTYWLPQGRYLFSGLFAIAVLMSRGGYQLLPRQWERWTTIVTVGLMVGFDLLCLGYLIVPHFFAQIIR